MDFASFHFFYANIPRGSVTKKKGLGITFNSIESFSISKEDCRENKKIKFGAKRFDFIKPPVAICNKLFDALFLPISLYSFEVWGTYDRTDAKKWGKDLLEKIHKQFYKHL